MACHIQWHAIECDIENKITGFEVSLRRQPSYGFGGVFIPVVMPDMCPLG